MTERGKDTILNELLYLRCRRGDERGWRDLLARWERPLLYYIRRLVPSEPDAWDVLQKTWLAAVRGIASVKDPALLPVWLHRVARNLAMSHYRGRQPAESLPPADFEPPADAEDAPDSQALALDDAAQVHRGLEKLSLPHREVLTLQFLQDLSIEQIAEVIDVSPGTVKSRLHYAKRALKALLDQEAKQ